MVRGVPRICIAIIPTPDSAADIRLRGMLYEALDCQAAAAADLRRYVALAPEAEDAPIILERAAKLADDTPTLH